MSGASSAGRMARLRRHQRADHELLLRLLTDPGVRAEARGLVALLPELAERVSDGVTAILGEHLPFAVTEALIDGVSDAPESVSDAPESVSDAPSEGFSAYAHEGADARSTSFLVTPLPSVKEEEGAPATFSEVRAILSPTRGYVHDERHLARLSGRYSDVDLVLEAMGMASWLYDNPKRTCSAAFMTNWVKKASSRQAPRSALARVLLQAATDPVAGPSTWESH